MARTSEAGSVGLRQQPITLGTRARRQIETRKRITEAATAVFQERGYDGATMRAIAARAGVATGTLFLHAPEKRSLLFMIRSSEVDRVTDDAFRSLQPGPLLDQIVHVFRVRYEYLGQDKRLALDALRQAPFLPDDDADRSSEGARYAARLNALSERIAALTREHQRAGTVSTLVDAEDVAEIAMALYSSEARIWLRKTTATLAEGMSVLRRRLGIALHGILTDAVDRPRPKAE